MASSNLNGYIAMTSNTEQEAIWTTADVKTLLSAFNTALGLMDGYYSTGDIGNDLREIHDNFKERINDLNPVVVETIHNAKCKICDKEFIRSNHGQVFTATQQNSAVMSHLINVHKIDDYNERKKKIQKAGISRVTYKNRNDFNRGIVQSSKREKA